MNFGTSDRAAHSADRSRTCCSEGTSPVKSSQKSPSPQVSTGLDSSTVSADLQVAAPLLLGLWEVVAGIPGSKRMMGQYGNAV